MKAKKLELEVGKKYSIADIKGKYIYAGFEIDILPEGINYFAKRLPKSKDVERITVLMVPHNNLEITEERIININKGYTPITLLSNVKNIIDRREFNKLKRILEKSA